MQKILWYMGTHLRVISESTNHKNAKTFEYRLNLTMLYSLEGSRWVISDEYPCAMISIIFRGFASFCIGQISHMQHKG